MHMLTEDPLLLFMHFWANDDALKLARSLRAALDRVKREADVNTSGEAEVTI